jgi:hypothetical protein
MRSVALWNSVVTTGACLYLYYGLVFITVDRAEIQSHAAMSLWYYCLLSIVYEVASPLLLATISYSNNIYYFILGPFILNLLFVTYGFLIVVVPRYSLTGWLLTGMHNWAMLRLCMSIMQLIIFSPWCICVYLSGAEVSTSQYTTQSIVSNPLLRNHNFHPPIELSSQNIASLEGGLNARAYVEVCSDATASDGDDCDMKCLNPILVLMPGMLIATASYRFIKLQLITNSEENYDED